MGSAPRGSPEQHLPWAEPRQEQHPAPEVWTCRLPTSGEAVAIVRTEVEASRLLCPDMLVFTLAEVAVAIEALGEAALEAKRAFPGATVTAVRKRSSPAEAKAGHPQTNARRKPPGGREHSPSKKMPKNTRYAGESFPASDIEERYREHMARQRAAARGDRR